jgi:DNA-binding beta-propeller fold protein YncE
MTVRRKYFMWIAGLLLALLSDLPTPVSAAGPLRFTWEAGSAETYAHPHDIVLSPDGTRLYVADNGNHRIAVLDPVSLEEIGAFGAGEVREPHDVAFDARGRLLVADTGNSRIAIFEVSDGQGCLVSELRGSIRRPEGVVVHPDGLVIATGAASGNLVVFREGKATAETGGFSAPHDVAIGPEGSIWVADAGNDRMVQLNDDLEVMRTLAGPPYDFHGPRYQDFDAAGRMFVADKYSNQIKIIAPDGSLAQVFGSKQSGKGDGVFNRPEGVEIAGEQVWFADTYNNRIVRYRID